MWQAWLPENLHVPDLGQLDGLVDVVKVVLDQVGHVHLAHRLRVHVQGILLVAHTPGGCQPRPETCGGPL